MNIPKRLYQYQSFNNYSLINLKNSNIYFNSPLNFNDPYDCLHNVTYKSISDYQICNIYGKAYKSRELEILARKIFNNSVTKSELVNFLKIRFEISKSEGKSFTAGLMIEDNIKGLKKDFEIEELFDKQKEEAIKIIKQKINDIITDFLENKRAEMSKSIGISCFSENKDDMLMWSYYANGHKGFCLEFDTSDEMFSKVMKVKYVSNSPIFDPSDLFHEDEGNNKSDWQLFDLFFATKHIDWDREKEWRLIHKVAGTQFGYSPKTLTGIYFGAQMDSVSREIILTILKNQNPFVKFYFMEKDPFSFKVVPIEMNYSTHLEGQYLFLSELILLFKSKKFTFEDLSNKINPLFQKSNIKTYLENLVHLGAIKKNGDEFQIINN